MASFGAFLDDVLREDGTERLPGMRAKVLVIVVPATTTVDAITLGGTALIEVDDSTIFQVGDTPRIRNVDGSVTEVVGAIIAITSGTGPHGKDEIEVPLLTGTYVVVDGVALIVRALVASGSTIDTSVGVSFETLADVTTGDANPVLAGESVFLALADKVWCECTTIGAAGEIDSLTVTGLQTPITGVVSVYNPEPGTGGSDQETDLDAKFRGMHRSTVANQETGVWLEALAKTGNGDVLRTLKATPTRVATMFAKVLRRNGGTFTDSELLALEGYCNDRVRSYMTTDFENITLTAVEVDAVITLDPDATLAGVFAAAASALVTYLDFRKRQGGVSVVASDLLSIVDQTVGVASLDVPSFLPATDIPVAVDSLPTLVRLSLKDAVSGKTINAALSASF
jgi:hypothetical protein